MDFHHLENIVCIAEEKSLAKAAEKRFVTQSALNQQLQKLESELGTPLFSRIRSNWTPTDAGRIYINAAKEMLLMRKEVYDRIGDLADRNQRHLTVGLIPERGVEMFTAVYPAFHEAYPEVRMEPRECAVRDMQKEISEGIMDLGLATLQDDQKDENQYHLLAEEEILLAVPSEHDLSAGGSRFPKEAPVTDLERFEDMPFIRIYERSTLFEITERLFARAGFTPKELFSTASNISKYRITETGLGCALLPETYALSEGNVVYFKLHEHPVWQITLCSRKGGYLGKPEQTFIRLCRDYWTGRVSGAIPAWT